MCSHSNHNTEAIQTATRKQFELKHGSAKTGIVARMIPARAVVVEVVM